jgi:ribose transport system ATP-binding protein
MVTHRLVEVERYADQMTILRDGVVVEQGPVANATRRQIISSMTGGAEGANASTTAPAIAAHPVPSPSPAARPTEVSREAWLVVGGLETGRLHGVSFEVRPGEILGFVGGPESGIEDVPLSLVGLIPATTSEFTVDGARSKLPSTPRRAMRMGVVLVPRDRLHQGIVGNFTVEENIILPRATNYWHKSRESRRVALDVIRRFDVRPPDPRRLASVLSGGNQQKVIIGKWLNCGPRLLILDDPGVGVDPRARQQIFEIIDEAVGEGISVIMLSSEPEELSAHCTRVLALSRGQVVAELSGDDVTYETMSRWAVS